MATNHYHSVDFTREANGETVTYNSYEDWGLYLTEPVVVSAPEPNTYMVEVPGRNGSLDLTESTIGTVTYQDREIEFPFLCRKKRKEWNKIYTDVMNAVHGRRCEITCSDDPDYTYEGRVTVDEWDADGTMAFPTLRATVRPFKTEKTEREYAVELSAESEKKIRLIGVRNDMYTINSGSGDAKKTVIVFGSKNVRSVDWSLFKALTVEYDKKAGRKVSIAVKAGDKSAGSLEQVQSTHYAWTLEKAKTTIAWEKIYRVTVEGDVSNVKIYGTLQANATITIEGSAKPAIPTIETTADVKITVNGQGYDVAKGTYFNENIIIRNDPVTFAIAAKNAVTGGETVTIRYRRGSL